MAVISSSDVGFLLIGGRSVLGAPITAIQEIRSYGLEQVDGLGEDYDRWASTGANSFELIQDGFYNSGLSSYHEALEITDPTVLMYAPVGNAIGDDFVGLTGVRTVYDKLGERGAYQRARATYRPSLGLGVEHMNMARVAAPLALYTVEGPTDLASDDWGAASTLGGAVYLGLSGLSLDGADSLLVTIRHSVDNIAFDDLTSFETDVDGVDYSGRNVIASGTTIRRYTRVRYEFTGAPGGDQTVLFAVGIGRN